MSPIPNNLIQKSKPPSAIAKQPNGAVADALLDVVDRPEPIWKMAALPARGMRAMHAAIKADLGITLFSTGRGRTLSQQWAIFGGPLARYRPCSKEEFDKNTAKDDELTKFWPTSERLKVAALLPTAVIPAAEHWTKIQLQNGKFPATAAVPGTSPHGFWCADDLAMANGDPITDQVAEWLFTHELAFGFAHGTRSERWHVQWVVGDTVPPAVAAFDGGTTHVDADHTPTDQATTNEELEQDDMAKAFKAADADAAFLVTGIVAAWVADPHDYDIAVLNGLAPNLDQVTTVDRATFGALRLVGAVPPGFSPAEFQEVVA